MEAIVWTKYGAADGLQLQEVEKPAPAANEVVIRTHATTVTAGDCEFRSLKAPFLYRLPIRLYVGFQRPRRLTILGQELAGEAEATGTEVTSFAAGDRVFGATGFRLGAYAEYICLPEKGALAKMPANMSYEEAAAVPVGGLEALHFLREARVQPGETVLINGASGSIGTFAIQLARHYGAEVTAVDSTDKLDRLRSLGAHHALEYTREDFSERGPRLDVIFDVVGKGSFSRSPRALKPDGSYLMAHPGFFTGAAARWIAMTGSRQIIRRPARQRAEDLVYLRQLIEAGELATVIDRRYALAQAAEAHRYVETGRKQGNVVIAVIPTLS